MNGFIRKGSFCRQWWVSACYPPEEARNCSMCFLLGYRQVEREASSFASHLTTQLQQQVTPSPPEYHYLIILVFQSTRQPLTWHVIYLSLICLPHQHVGSTRQRLPTLFLIAVCPLQFA